MATPTQQIIPLLLLLLLLSTSLILTLIQSPTLPTLPTRPTTVSTTPHQLLQQFQIWQNKYGKQYSDESEKVYRFGIFVTNLQKIRMHNSLAQAGKYRYFLGINYFADFTEFEFKGRFLWSKGTSRRSLKEVMANITTKCTGAIADSPNPPDFLNWTEKAVDKNVIMEGSCAGNYAFSAVGAVEALVTIKLEKTFKLSDQQIIDCSGDYGNEGCNGGFMDQAYWYIIDNGMASATTYPYIGKSQSCKYTQSQKVVKIGRCAKVPTGIYQKLISAVIQQPVTVAVSSQKFMLYERGIFDGDCTNQIDRGMLLVGYGSQDAIGFWILKNSLGVSWGEKGYIRLKRVQGDGPGMCGIQLAASVPQNPE